LIIPTFFTIMKTVGYRFIQYETDIIHNNFFKEDF